MERKCLGAKGESAARADVLLMRVVGLMARRAEARKARVVVAICAARGGDGGGSEVWKFSEKYRAPQGPGLSTSQSH